MRGFIIKTIGFVSTIAVDLRQAGRGFVRRHFDLFTAPDTGALRGMFIKLPGLPFSAMLEWREQNLGWEVEREQGCLKVWAGRLEGSFCREPTGFQMGQEVR
ncbi:hypothetical protein [Pseudaminobacter soli (ex Li et al. 2025)]|uniref:Uncharacterized protein n=1 Tax=Pseudaminobacter soli (ex Li et al. 2025) TaxID=1295366 RepID=A0A2P7RSF8_9HYPH|nr:hypothetical protein [Mesorhizobium soli]PSJ53133.1 hypothetical protein C7I85_28460 [Mesorhizobium soli]